MQLSAVCAQPGSVGLFPSEIPLRMFLALLGAEVGRMLELPLAELLKLLPGQETRAAGKLLAPSL